jgi:hypothetical protein
VPDLEDGHHPPVVVYLVDYPVLPDPDTSPFFTSKPEATSGTRIFCKVVDGSPDAFSVSG